MILNSKVLSSTKILMTAFGVMPASCQKQAAPVMAAEPDKTALLIEEGQQQPRTIYVDGQFADYLIPKSFERINFKSQAAADSWQKLTWHQKLIQDTARPGVVYVWYPKEMCYKPAPPDGH